MNDDTPKKRGRPRKPDDQLKRPRAKKAEEKPPEVGLEVAQIEVGDTRAALSVLDEAERREIERESRRFSLAAEIAKHRWTIAKNYHRIEDGQALSFDDRPFLIDIYKDPSPDLLIHGSAQFGKAQPKDAKIHTPSGWINMGDVEVGYSVSIPDGGSAKVIGVFPQGKKPVYRLTMIDGRSVEACGEHFWEVYANGAKRILTTDKMRELHARRPKHILLPLTEPVETGEVDLPIDPYLMGVLLGDGDISGNLRISTVDQEIVDSANELVPAGYELHAYESDKITYHIRRVGGVRKTNRNIDGSYSQHPVKESLRKLGLWGTDCFSKFIPRIYLEASVCQRFALLQGLMDTDGWSGRSIGFSSASIQLAKDVQRLVWSLGGIARWKEKSTSYEYKGERRQGSTAYTLGIRHPNARRLFRLARKRDNAGSREPGSLKLSIRKIEYVGEKDCQCICVDHPRHMYITDNWICTRNTEWMICDLAASAGIAGLKVLFITSKQEKRNKFVSGRIDPCFNSVPMYKQLFQAAQNRAATADSTGLKHFGAGSINFLFANASAKGEFTSWPADKYMVDEHQECDSNSLLKLPDRLSGSKYKFTVNVGHPSYPGSQTLQNLDFMYQNSDQRRWYIRCQNCSAEFEVNWWEHIVEEVRSESGAILSVEPRDKDFISDANGIDLKPICSMCKRPTNRLTRDAFWKQLNPGAARHGYRLSNLCNVNERLSDLYTRYLNARHLPEAMFEFYTKQLGICYTMSGTQINEKMLRDCTTGDYTGIRPYSFAPVSSFNWRSHRGAA